jgi:hypothetical protein
MSAGWDAPGHPHTVIIGPVEDGCGWTLIQA